jgi:parallel beta-helix repeat protein
MNMRRLALVIVVFALLPPRFATAAADAPGLQEQIDKAPAGGELVVPKGVWNEPLKISKAVTLRGADRDACVIDVVSDEPAIRLAHGKGEAVLENLTVRWKLATSERSAEVQAAIAAKDGAVRLRNVRVTAPDSYARCPSAFTAQGFCNAKIEKCEFEGYEFTLQFGGGATGSVSDSIVSKSGHCGITGGPDTTVNVARTIITGSRFHGLRSTGGELNVEHNLVIANKNRGIYLGNKSARGTIRENVIQDNGSGISAFDRSEVKIQNNLISGCDFAAIDMRDGCELAVERNLLVSNGRGMVLFPESGTNRNTIGRNASAANKTETEGFKPPPELVKVEGKLEAGAFAMETAREFGLSDAEQIKPLWKRWTELRAKPTTQQAAAAAAAATPEAEK